MTNQKEYGFSPLLKSKNGLHLTIYLKNTGGVKDLRHQIYKAIDQSYKYLTPAVPVIEHAKFLDPIRSLAKDSALLSGIKGNLGIFRSKDTFRIVSIPMDVEFTSIVATSFHVKPLLKWIQMDQEFLLLGIEDGCAQLYSGSMYSIDRRDTILFPEVLKAQSRGADDFDFRKNIIHRVKIDQTADWLNEWLHEVTLYSKRPLYLAGPDPLTSALAKKVNSQKLDLQVVRPFFSQHQLGSICSEIRSKIRQDVQNSIRLSFIEFFDAEFYNLGKRNLFQVAKAVCAGQVKKLIIADGIQIFGRLDTNTGSISIHNTDMDHEDDDILDDLAQQVLVKGGEVVVAPSDQIPKGRSALAILKDPPSNLSLNYAG